MGLDIHAYKTPAFADLPPAAPQDLDDLDEWLWENNYRRVWTNPDFPHAEEGITRSYFTFEKEIDAFSGGYGYYNAFRESLADFSGKTARTIWDAPESYRSLPFFELIHFSDCDGTFGPVSTKALLEDLVEHAGEYLAKTTNERFMHSYKVLLSSLREAGSGAILGFH